MTVSRGPPRLPKPRISLTTALSASHMAPDGNVGIGKSGRVRRGVGGLIGRVTETLAPNGDYAPRNAATAQEAYFVDNNTYASGACTTLPGFTGSGGVVCNTTGTATRFTVTTSQPSMSSSTGWTSNPGSGNPNLICS